MKTVILAEKPSVAKEIAHVLGVKNQKDGYLENEQYQITWAYGHLVELAPPDHYNAQYSKWNLSDLPIIPDKFSLVVKDEPSAKKQFKVIKTLFLSADKIINATDAGREGELIFRYIYNLSTAKAPVERLWISSMTKESISKGFNQLQSGKSFDNLYFSAYSRSVSDWIIGLNITRAFTLVNSSSKVLSLGRVQTPTLYMIVNRFLENKNFVSRPYFIPNVNFIHKGINVTASYIYTDYLSVDQAQNIVTQSKGLPLVVKDVKNETKKVAPNLLLDLTNLQQICNTSFGYTADKTLGLTQSLYETHKIVTYPRTESRHLTDDMLQTVVETITLFKNFSEVSPFLGNIQKDLLALSNKRVFNNDKVSDHHAIIPTFNKDILSIYQKLDKDEKNVFQVISEYFIKAFFPDYVYKSKIILLNIKDYPFKAQGTQIVDTGWKVDFFNQKTIDPQSSEENQILPDMEINTSINDYKFSVSEKKTTPPELLNEALLLRYMNNVHTFFKDISEDLANIKHSGIGTPATRAATIETLKKRNYITISNRKLIPTDLGLLVYDVVKNEPISSPITTAQLEEKLENVKNGLTSIVDIQKDIRSYTVEMIEHITAKNSTKSFSDLQHKQSELGCNCPKCGKPMRIGNKNYYCSGYPDCNFSVFNTFLNKNLSQAQVKELLISGKTKTIKGFVSSKGKKFDAAITLNRETYKLELQFN